MRRFERNGLNPRGATGFLAVLGLSVALLQGCGSDNNAAASEPTPVGGNNTPPAPTVVTASGDITAAVDQFRTLLGDPNNGGTAGQQAGGRREINWDGGPDSNANNDNFPFNAFKARGLYTLTLGTGFRISTNDFSDINPNYANQFAAFSPARTFMSVGSNHLDVVFRVAGSDTPAAVKGFGVVFSDVDVDGSTLIEPFEGTRSLGVFRAPVRSGNTSFSFIGVAFDSAKVTSVRIVSGHSALGTTIDDITDGGDLDLVVMDDFIYGEPTATP